MIDFYFLPNELLYYSNYIIIFLLYNSNYIIITIHYSNYSEHVLPFN